MAFGGTSSEYQYVNGLGVADGLERMDVMRSVHIRCSPSSAITQKTAR